MDDYFKNSREKNETNRNRNHVSFIFINKEKQKKITQTTQKILQ